MGHCPKMVRISPDIILMKNTIEQYESVHKISVLMAYAQVLLINPHADISRVHTGKYEQNSRTFQATPTVFKDLKLMKS